MNEKVKGLEEAFIFLYNPFIVRTQEFVNLSYFVSNL